VLAAASFDLSGRSVTVVGNIVIADDSTHALVFRFPVSGAGKGGLEAAVDPISGVVGDGATSASEVLEVGAVVGEGNCGEGGDNVRLLHLFYI